MATTAGETSGEGAWVDYEFALSKFNLAYGRLSVKERIRANRSVINGMSVSLWVAGVFWLVPPIPIRNLLYEFSQRIISPAFAQQTHQALPEALHWYMAIITLACLVFGFVLSLYTVLRNPKTTSAQRDIAKVFIGFFVGMGSRFFT
jgi:hypothetical protein